MWQPNARITLVVRESLVQFARGCPSVDEVIGVPVTEGEVLFDPVSNTYRKWCRQTTIWLRVCKRARLWKRRFDLAVVLRWPGDYYGATLLAYLSGSRERMGVNEQATLERSVVNYGYDQLLTRVVQGKCDGHEYLLNRRLARELGCAENSDTPPTWVSIETRALLSDIFLTAGIKPEIPLVALCMGAGVGRKMWPVERYGELCRTAFADQVVQFVCFGTAAEASLGHELRLRMGEGMINLEGKIPLECLAAAMELCSLYIGSDTGTMHLAAAAKVPVFCISCHPLDGDPLFPESPSRFGPWGTLSRVIQPKRAEQPCSDQCYSLDPHCILQIEADDAATEMLSWLDDISWRERSRSFLSLPMEDEVESAC